MARIGRGEGPDITEQAVHEGDGLESGTPKDAGDLDDDGGKEGLHLARPRAEIVGEYPERSYREAISAPHLEVLKAAGQAPE